MSHLLVVPGLRQAYTDLLAENLRHFSGWECRAYSAEALSRWPSQCRLEIHSGWKWASMLNLTTSALDTRTTHILVLLDDVRIPEDFCMPCFLRDVRRHAVASPVVANATWPTTRGTYCTSGGSCQTGFLETYLKLFARPAFQCYARMFSSQVLDDATQAVGWGYDRCFAAMCPFFEQRLFRDYQVEHVATSGGLGYLSHVAYPQSRRLQRWVRQTSGRPCVRLGSV